MLIYYIIYLYYLRQRFLYLNQNKYHKVYK